MTRACIIEPSPPFVDDAIWHVVCHFSDQKTLWRPDQRRISLQTTQPSTAAVSCVEIFPAAGVNEMPKQAVATKTKQPTETKMEESLPVQYENPYLEVAAETSGGFGKILKFVKGEFVIGEDVIPEGTEFIAYLDQLARTLIKFEDGVPVDRRIELVASGRKLPNREELGDTDKKKWETDDAGVPVTPGCSNGRCRSSRSMIRIAWFSFPAAKAVTPQLVRFAASMAVQSAKECCRLLR